MTYSEADNSPPPEDSLAAYRSSLNISGLAEMPTTVAVHIPREGVDDVVATLRLERMDRREGFGERDPQACDQGDLSGCEIVPYPDFSPELFSYTWVGQGSGFDLRITVHQGHAVGVLSGPKRRYAISWNALKELRVEYFRMDDSFDERGDTSTPTMPTSDIPVLDAAEAQDVTLARIEPQRFGPTGAANTQLDLLFLFTEEARQQAGGNPADCRDVSGLMASIHQRINDMNAAFFRSDVPAQIGVATVTKLTGYTLIPFVDQSTVIQNRENITTNANIKAYRNAVGADVVSVLFDTQAHLGPCGAANTQRHGCTIPPTPGCDVGPQFSEWSTYLDTIECTVVDVPTHELGHVLGAEHHRGGDNGSSTPPSIASFPYSYGYGFGSGLPDGFETIMSQRFNLELFPVRLLQFSNVDLLYMGRPTGWSGTAENARTLTNLIPGTAGFRTRPPRIFFSGFDETNACPSISY